MGTAVQNAMRKKSQQWMKRGFSAAKPKKKTQKPNIQRKNNFTLDISYFERYKLKVLNLR